MVVWVTGADGFIGSALVRNLAHSGIRTLMPSLDIRDTAAIQKVVSENSFDAVIHLAGMSSVKECEINKSLAFSVNSEAVYHLGEAIAKIKPQAQLIFPSTGHVYQSYPMGTQEEIYTEKSSVLPRNFYALTKLQAEENLKFLAKNRGLKATVLRLFNHTHKSQTQDFFLPSVYGQLLSAKKRGEKKALLTVGDIDVRRDIGAIQDLALAFQTVLFENPYKSDEVKTFNISSGHAVGLRDLVNQLADKMEMEVDFKVDPQLIRENEPKSVVGINS
ncbi:MAG TPA: SDR family oxidoreductase, partial [Pseudobdellovibrionaceae bacterium]